MTGGGRSRVSYDFNCETKTENYGKIGAPNKNQGELRVPSSWQKFNTEVGLHPTQKPVALFQYLIRTYSNKGELVLDCCIGSGTTAVACRNEQRDYVGFETDRAYFESALARLK